MSSCSRLDRLAPRGLDADADTSGEEERMGRQYNVIDADGHILEPFTLWNEYLDPAFRDRAPRLIKDNHGKQRLLLEAKLLGSRAGFGGIGGVGARQGVVAAESMDYEDGRKGGFDPHARIPDMDLDGIDAAFLYPSLGLFTARSPIPPSPARCAAPTTAGSPTTASPTPTGCSASPCCRCSRSRRRSRR
jgi:hypothetical protein